MEVTKRIEVQLSIIFLDVSVDYMYVTCTLNINQLFVLVSYLFSQSEALKWYSCIWHVVELSRYRDFDLSFRTRTKICDKIRHTRVIVGFLVNFVRTNGTTALQNINCRVEIYYERCSFHANEKSPCV